MASNFGLVEMGAVARDAEEAAKANEVKQLQAILPALPSASERAHEAIRGWLES